MRLEVEWRTAMELNRKYNVSTVQLYNIVFFFTKFVFFCCLEAKPLPNFLTVLQAATRVGTDLPTVDLGHLRLSAFPFDRK